MEIQSIEVCLMGNAIRGLSELVREPTCTIAAILDDLEREGSLLCRKQDITIMINDKPASAEMRLQEFNNYGSLEIMLENGASTQVRQQPLLDGDAEVLVTSRTGAVLQDLELEMDVEHTIQDLLEYLESNKHLQKPRNEIVVKVKGYAVKTTMKLAAVIGERKAVLDLEWNQPMANENPLDSDVPSLVRNAAVHEREQTRVISREQNITLKLSSLTGVMNHELNISPNAKIAVWDVLEYLQSHKVLKIPCSAVSVMLLDGTEVLHHAQLQQLAMHTRSNEISLLLEAHPRSWFAMNTNQLLEQMKNMSLSTGQHY